MTIVEPSIDEKERIERSLHLRIFSDEELAGRMAKARTFMAEAGLDAMLLTHESNVVYFSGLTTPSFATTTRPIMMLIPILGDPILICSRSQSAHARAASWVADIRTFDGFEVDALAVLSDVLRGLGSNRRTIGCEFGDEQRMGLTYAGFTGVVERSSHAFVDASRVVWATRAVKSATEIDYLREAARINGVAFDRVADVAAVGMSERSIRREWAIALAEEGADKPGYLSMHSGPGSYRRVSGSPSDRVLAQGDLLWMDGGPTYRGYWSDITRTISFGEPDPEHERLYEFSWLATRELLRAAKPGVTAGSLSVLCQELFADAGLTLGSASRIGHGIGADLTEPPSIIEADETELLSGMALAIEPAVARWDGYFIVEEDFIVTDTGSELISAPAPKSITIAGRN